MESKYGSILIIVGIVFIVAGIILKWEIGPGSLGNLPGDFSYKNDNFSFYFPLTTCLLISGLIGLVRWLWRYFSGE